MSWSIAPTDEFVGVWISQADCSDRRVCGCLDSPEATSTQKPNDPISTDLGWIAKRER